MNHWLITYDMPNDRRRTRIAAILTTLGERVQYSVFEVQLNARQEEFLVKEIEKTIDPAEDSIRWYPMHHDTLIKIREYGCGQAAFPTLPTYHII